MRERKNTVAVTGIGVVTPAVKSFDEITKDKICSVNIEKTISGVPHPDGQNARELRRLSKLARIAVSAAGQALKMSGHPAENMGTGVALSHGSTSYLADFHELLYTFGADNASPAAFSNGVTNAPLSTVSTMFGLKSGGITFTGLESAGIDILSEGAYAVLFNEYDSYIAGAIEEYSPFLEKIYTKCGWYNGRIPPFLPAENASDAGYALSEGGAFLVLEPYTNETVKRAFALYQPITPETVPNDVDLVISGASGGPQDRYEIDFLKTILASSSADCVFTAAVTGNCFALGSMLSNVLACACIRDRSVIVPRHDYHPAIEKYVKQKTDISNVLVTGASRDGAVSCGMFYIP